MDENYLGVRGGKVMSYVGPDATAAFRAITIASALRFYAKTGMKVNRSYSPKLMMSAAANITQKIYKRGEYLRAADDLMKWADEMKAALPVREEE
jgi:hypothetical protein